MKNGRAVRKPAVRAAAKPPAAPAQPAAETPWRRTPYVGALAADEKGRVLFASNAVQPARPASVTKLMTALLVLEDVAAGRYGFGSEVKPSAVVYKSEPSSMELKPGVPVTVEQLLSYIKEGTDDRIYAISQLMWMGVDAAVICDITQIDMFFIDKIKHFFKVFISLARKSGN